MMQLYHDPGACSLSDHIALRESGFAFDLVRVDIFTKKTERGEDFREISPKGYVPALVLDDGQLLTENAAILTWIAMRAPHLAPPGELGLARLVEMLAYVGSEIHKPFIRWFFTEGTAKDELTGQLAGRLGYLADRLEREFLFGDGFTTADCYLYVMLHWAWTNGFPVPSPLDAYRERVVRRPAVLQALKAEGLA